jgi:hypothetical protein
VSIPFVDTCTQRESIAPSSQQNAQANLLSHYVNVGGQAFVGPDTLKELLLSAMFPPVNKNVNRQTRALYGARRRRHEFDRASRFSIGYGLPDCLARQVYSRDCSFAVRSDAKSTMTRKPMLISEQGPASKK